MLEDKLLILELNRGSKDSLRRIYEKYRDDLLRLATALLNDTDTAEDVIQDVFVSVARSAGQLRIRRNLKGYLLTCVINHIRNRIKAAKLRETSDLSKAISSDLDTPEEWIICSEEFKRISNAIAQLPYAQREVITLHLQGQMKFKEIAKLQDVSIKTIQSRYRYGLEKIRTILNSEMGK